MSKEILLEMRTIKKEEFIEWFRQMGERKRNPMFTKDHSGMPI